MLAMKRASKGGCHMPALGRLQSDALVLRGNTLLAQAAATAKRR